MGWLFTEGQSRAELIARLTKPWDSNGISARCLEHACIGNVHWTVWEHRRANGEVKRIIGCDLMRFQRGYGWGYKDMSESAHPYYYSCPLKYIEMVPVACGEWRTRVREYHAERAQSSDKVKDLRVGQNVPLVGCSIPFVTITDLRPLRGVYGGTRYRIPRKFLG